MIMINIQSQTYRTIKIVTSHSGTQRFCPANLTCAFSSCWLLTGVSIVTVAKDAYKDERKKHYNHKIERMPFTFFCCVLSVL